MKKISVVGVGMWMIILSLTTNSLAQQERSLKGMLYTHVDVFIPSIYLLKLEWGIKE